MFEADVRYINEVFEATSVSPSQLDDLLALGWRHFGAQFYRYNIGIHEFDIQDVIPLRIRLCDFSISKSQRRVLRYNSDLEVSIRPIAITDEVHGLFERHKLRFKFGIPDSIYDFISNEPSCVPCDAREVDVRFEGRLIAVSYFDLGARSVSAVYGMFEPEFRERSLGIFTMLKEIEYAIANGREFYYQGYAYEGASFYDYKKRFHGTEIFDWKGNWMSSGFRP